MNNIVKLVIVLVVGVVLVMVVNKLVELDYEVMLSVEKKLLYWVVFMDSNYCCDELGLLLMGMELVFVYEE